MNSEVCSCKHNGYRYYVLFLDELNLQVNYPGLRCYMDHTLGFGSMGNWKEGFWLPANWEVV